MDSKYVSSVPEIDVQHEEIAGLVSSLRDAIARKDRRHLVHQALKQLHHQLITHFAFEDTLMVMVNHPDLVQHRKIHKQVLSLFDKYFEHPPDPIDYEHLGKLIADKVHGHFIEDDFSISNEPC